MNQNLIAQSLRSATVVNPIDTAELLDYLEPTDFIRCKVRGQIYVRIVTPSGQYLPVRVSQWVDDSANGALDLLQNFRIVTGETTNGRFYSFEDPNNGVEILETVSFAQLMNNGGVLVG